MAGRLNGKVAVVTGAGSGMGAAMAEAFCIEGAKVVAADISGKQDEVAERIGGLCVPAQVDVADGDSIQAMLNLVVKHFGRLDIICNNAGVQGDNVKTADYELAEFDRIMAINCRGVFMGMKYAIPLLLKSGGGSIVNTSSMASLVAFPGMAAYCASKGAVSMLTKLTAAEYAAQNIRVNAILPGAIDTGMARALPPDVLAGAVKATLMGRIGRPSEIANLAVFFASDESSFITGTLVPVDGGYTLL
jgi:NAD(P)-dependent dehydrogenase (short-subunit alcohol dehydrogenase family)